MLPDPTEGGSFIEPGRYVLRIVKMEAMPPTPEHPDWRPSIRFTLNLQDYTTRKVMMDKNEQPYEWWVYRSATLAQGTKTRQFTEAFLGRSLIEGQDAGEAVAKELLGKKAIGMVGPNQKGKDDILGVLQPYKEPAKATPAKVSAAVATLEDDLPEHQRSGAVAVAEPDEDFAF